MMAKTWGGKEFISLTVPHSKQFIIKYSESRNSNRAGCWRQELMQRQQRSVAYWLVLRLAQPVFLRNPGIAIQGG